MAKNQSTYTLHIDAELGNLQQTLNTAKNALASFMQSGSAPKGLEKAFEKINDLLGQISDKTGKPLDLKGLTGAGKDLNTVQESFRAIVRLLGEFDELSDDVKLTFLSAEEQKKVTAITEALKNYGVAAENSAKKIKELENAQKSLTKNGNQLHRAKKNVGDLEGKKLSKEAALSGAQGKLSAAVEVGADPEKIAAYQAKVVQLEADLRVLNQELAEANQELITAQQVYDSSAQAVANLGKEAKQASLDALHGLKEEAKKLGISLEGLNGHDAAAQIEILKRRLSEFKSEAMSGAKPAFDAIKDGCVTAQDAVEQLGVGVQEATEAVRSMDQVAGQRDAFEAKIKSFLGLSGAAQVMRSALRDAMQTITELDATMTEMAVVTNLTVGDYWDQLPEYSKRASELGVSINDAYKAATLYYQQGLKSNEVTAISAETLKLAKIAGIDAAEATDKMTAALRGFNMELNETSAQKIADVYAELAAITAADVNEISTAMTKTASIASSAGMEFETTAAFLSQIIETTRESAETAGTAMKTVIARFQELKKDPSEIGEVEGEIVDANAIETALRSVGVSLRDANGQFRELDEVFLELSSKWDGLDKNTQRYIATIAAGSRQQSRFIAMMQDYNRTQELVSAANTSAGASNKQFEKTMESLKSKIEKLKNAWHEFTMGIMNSDLVKVGVDILTKFLEIINKATSSFDGMAGSITKVLGILTVFKVGSTIFEKLKAPLIKFFADIVKEAGVAGENAAKAAKEGVEKVAKEESGKKGQNPTTVGQKIKNKTGYSKLSSGLKGLKTDRARRTHEQAYSDFEKAAENQYQEPEKYAKAVENLSKAQQKYNGEIVDTDKAWKEVQEGIAEAGQALSGFGVGLSVVGGVLSSVGLEGFGDTLANIGNWAMLAGTAISALAPAIVFLGKNVQIVGHKIVLMGGKIQLAWWQVALIVAGIAAMIIGIVALAKHLKSITPEAKLKAAQEAADKAAEAADNAAESYQNLADSLEGLGGKYEELDKLAEGTAEWNDAVNKLNTSVLQLITNYPELAALVQNDNGVLRLDTSSADVMNILAEYRTKSIKAQSVSLGAKREVIEAQQDVDSKYLSKFSTRSGQGHRSDAMEEAAINALRTGKTDYDSIYKDLQTIDPTLTDREARKLAEAMSEDREALLEYANTINETNAQMKALDQAIATQASQLVDWSQYGENKKEAQNIGSSIVTGDLVEQKRKELEKKYLDNDDDESVEKELWKYMESLEGVDEVKRIKNNKIVYIDNEGKKQKVNKETYIKQMIDSKITGEISTEMNKAASAILSSGRDDMVRIFSDSSGSNFTAADLNKLSEEELRNVFASMGENAKAIWGSAEKFIEDYNNRIEQGTKLYDENNTKLAEFGINLKQDFGFMSADIASIFTERISEAYYTGGTAAGNALVNEYKNILSKVDSNEDKSAMTTLINSADWDTIEGIQRLQEELQKQYGIGEKESEAFAQALAKANKATEEITVSEERFGEFYQATQRVNKALRDLNKLQWQYEKALKGEGNAKELLLNLEEQREQALLAAQESLVAREKQLEIVADVYAKGVNEIEGVDLTKLVRRSEVTGEFDVTDFNAWIQRQDDPDTIDTANKWLDSLLENNDIALDQLKTAQEQCDVLEDLQETAEQAYWELYDQFEELMSTEMQEQIDIQRDLLDATNDANNQLLNKLQEQIDEERNQRQLDEAKDNLEDMYAKAAMLGMDNSGANALELLNMEKQIAQAEQELQDSMIDQSIQQLQDSNDKAAEQRERQISIAEEQLAAYKKSEEFQEDVQKAYGEFMNRFKETVEKGEEFDAKKDEFGARLIKAGFLDGLNDLEESQFWQAIKENTTQAAEHTGDKNDASLGKLVKDIRAEVLKNARENVIKENLAAAAQVDTNFRTATGFDISGTGSEKEFTSEVDGLKQFDSTGAKDYIDKVNNIERSQNILVSRNSDAEDMYNKLTDNGKVGGVLSKQQFYSILNDPEQGSVTVGNTTFTHDNLSTWLETGASSEASRDYLAYLEAAKNISGNSMANYWMGLAKAEIWRLAGQYNYMGQTTYEQELNNDSSNLSKYKQNYIEASGSEDFFMNQIAQESFNTGKGVLGRGASAADISVQIRDYYGKPLAGGPTITIDGNSYKTVPSELAEDQAALQNLYGLGSVDAPLIGLYNGQPFYSIGQGWMKILNYGGGTGLIEFVKKKIHGLTTYKTGGLADFTGPAWLDGTPSKPEYILSAKQTEKFFSLIDVLENYDTNKNNSGSGGDNYFDININVEKIEDDYDVEQMANKIRRMIYEDASYRNVNSINHIR